MIQRIRRRLQVLPGKVQVDSGGLDIHVPHEQLDGSQIRAGFEQVRRVTMPQRVRCDALADPGAFGRLANRHPDDLRCDGLVDAPVVDRAGEQIRLGTHPTVVLAQRLEKLPAQGQDTSAADRTVEIEIIDEERKLALNGMRSEPDDLFTSLSRLLESDLPAARVVDYLDDDEDPYVMGGLESDPGAVPPYRAKNGPVVAHEELLDIPELEEGRLEEEAGVFETLRTATSVTDADDLAEPNLNTLDVEVLEALWATTGFNPAKARMLADCRDNVVFEKKSEIVQKVTDAVDGCGLGLEAEEENLLRTFGVSSQSFTVISAGQLTHPAVAVLVEARIWRSPDGSEAPRILAWREL